MTGLFNAVSLLAGLLWHLRPGEAGEVMVMLIIGLSELQANERERDYIRLRFTCMNSLIISFYSKQMILF
jgi:hypothetical protein